MGKRKGLLFVISGPSGCGKTTLGEKILSGDKNLVRSVSVTTRPRRKGEKEGREYFFVSEKEFTRLREEDSFLEWAKIFGYFYGTPKEFVLKNINQGKDVILIIDVQGARQVRKKFPQAISIFLTPPSLKTLQERLKKRRLDGPGEIEKRLQQAEKELRSQREYDYIVMNKDLDKATELLSAIISLERIKFRR
ncbi:MAG: guanylate kinase [Candidatus Omnitrophica bacterium]|nr:guanylate kinase [Candidatus Omnitrophota bacterium]MCM8792868.1 guanylate kinase [Candidatus Omnitrophota bacterium]